MRRKVFDKLASAGGLVMVVVLVVAGALLLWGNSFTNSNVHNELARQEIFFPTAKTMNTPKSENYISRSVQLPYAGQQVLTGAQAKAYAYKVQMDIYGLPFHGVYSKISGYSITHPTTKKFAALVTVSFRGTTLQGLLLNAYAFSVFATIAFWAAIAAFCLAAVMALLVGMGFWHASRTPEDVEILTEKHETKEIAA